MKISNIHYEDCTAQNAGGIDIYIRSFIKNAKGIDFTCWSLGERNKTAVIGNNVVQCNVLVPVRKRYRFVPETLRTIYYIWLKLRKINNGQDAILFHSSTYLWPYLIKKKSLPSILIIGGTNSPITRMAVGWRKALFVAYSDYYAMKKADRVILVSREGLNYYQNKYPKYKDKMLFYPTFADGSIFHKEDLGESKSKLGLADKTVLCYVGRLTTQKRVELVISIFKHIVVKRKDSFLCIVGDGADREKLVRVVKTLKIESNVRFYGNIPHEQVKTFYSASVLSFTLSYWEGTAQTILESLACGTPVIVSDVADNRQIITNGEDGYVLDSDDETKGAELAIKIIDNHDEFSKNALQKGRRYLASEIVPMLIREIESVIKK